MRLSDDEISRLAVFEGLGEWDFIQNFTRLAADRRGLVLLDKSNGECVFLEDGNCAVQAMKPQQCRDFPNLWNFPGFEKICLAIPKVVSGEDYERLVGKSDEIKCQKKGRWM